jgi:hypothetical protein
MPSSMTHGHKTQRHKIEVLTANYPIAGGRSPPLFVDMRSSRPYRHGRKPCGHVGKFSLHSPKA